MFIALLVLLLLLAQVTYSQVATAILSTWQVSFCVRTNLLNSISGYSYTWLTLSNLSV